MAALGRLVVLWAAALPGIALAISDDDAALHAQRAQTAEKSNNFATAVREYEYLVHRFPQSAEVKSNLGVALYFDHELKRAVSVLEQAIALNSNLLAPHLFAGLAWYRLSNPDAAISELLKAVEISPADVIGHTWLGYSYLARGDYDNARQQLQRATQLDPNNLDAWYQLGQTYLLIGKRATLQLVGLFPDGARVWQLAGEQARFQGDHKRALDDLQHALKRQPDSPELRAAVAELGGSVNVPGAPNRVDPHEDSLYWQAHDSEAKARMAFARVTQIGPDSYRAHQIMGDSLTLQQRFTAANEEYRTALKLNPELVGLHEEIGVNLLRTGATVEALAEFKAELAIQPQSASAQTYVGEALLLLGRDNEAGKAFRDATMRYRPPVELHRLMGKLYLRRKDYPDAIRALTGYLAVRKDDGQAYYLLSRAYRGAGEREQSQRALSTYEKVSRDARVRARAQAELASFNQMDFLTDLTSDSLNSERK